MQRLKWLVVIWALALMVGVVEAGPAAAAKGGNNDTANLCQQGGWQTLVTRTGEDFKNQGDCVNDGAQGSAPFAGRPPVRRPVARLSWEESDPPCGSATNTPSARPPTMPSRWPASNRTAA